MPRDVTGPKLAGFRLTQHAVRKPMPEEAGRGYQLSQNGGSPAERVVRESVPRIFIANSYKLYQINRLGIPTATHAKGIRPLASIETTQPSPTGLDSSR